MLYLDAIGRESLEQQRRRIREMAHAMRIAQYKNSDYRTALRQLTTPTRDEMPNPDDGS